MNPRQELQLKNWKKMVRELKADVAQMYIRKVLHDSYYINYKNLRDEVSPIV